MLVTGGSRGIGHAIVEHFSRANWRVATCSRSIDRLADSTAEYAFACDVTQADAVRAGVDAVAQRFGRIDVLVNNAGLAGSNPLTADSDDDLWHRIIDVNLHGTYYLSKAVLPHMPDGGRIINIGSVLSQVGVADQSAYTAAKHAVLGFTRALAQHTAARRITVNCICPGWVDTEMARERWQALGIDRQQAADEVPLRRVTAPGEIAALVQFLVSDAGAAMTGQAITVDGGMLC